MEEHPTSRREQQLLLHRFLRDTPEPSIVTNGMVAAAVADLMYAEVLPQDPAWLTAEERPTRRYPHVVHEGTVVYVDPRQQFNDNRIYDMEGNLLHEIEQDDMDYLI